MALVILVGLYSSRVILNALGVEDFGIYNVAGSVVAMFSFLNGALGGSSSRFITVELGKSNEKVTSHLISCFKTTLSVHAIMAGIILVISESIGLWLLYNKCDIPVERMDAALVVYQISVLTALLSIFFVPFQALIIAHEHMSVYAYVGVLDALAKLGVCFLIQVGSSDKLVIYAFYILLIQLANFLFYCIYSKKHFAECQLGFSLDSRFFKPILGFTGWSLLGSFSSMAMTSAATVIISFFFGPAVVAARALASQVKSQISNFINNFRTAVNPQILKQYAAGDTVGYKKLLFFSTSVSFYLMLVLTLPLLFETETVLKLWLKNVPEYTVPFLRLTLIEILFVVYDISYYMIFQATGRLKENALICPTMDLVAFAAVYLIYYCGGDVLAIAWALVILTIAQGMIVKPWLAIRYHGYTSKEFLIVFYRNGLVFATATVLPLVVYCLLDRSLVSSLLVILTAIISVIIATYSFGFSKENKARFNEMIKYIINKIRKK